MLTNRSLLLLRMCGKNHLSRRLKNFGAEDPQIYHLDSLQSGMNISTHHTGVVGWSDSSTNHCQSFLRCSRSGGCGTHSAVLADVLRAAEVGKYCLLGNLMGRAAACVYKDDFNCGVHAIWHAAVLTCQAGQNVEALANDLQ